MNTKIKTFSDFKKIFEEREFESTDIDINSTELFKEIGYFIDDTVFLVFSFKEKNKKNNPLKFRITYHLSEKNDIISCFGFIYFLNDHTLMYKIEQEEIHELNKLIFTKNSIPTQTLIKLKYPYKSITEFFYFDFDETDKLKFDMVKHEE